MSGELGSTWKNVSDSRRMNDLEREIFTLDAAAPELLGELPRLFEEAVRESLGRMLGMKGSAGVLRWLQDAGLENRPEVFARLASHYGTRASPLQTMIDEAFERRFHKPLPPADEAQAAHPAPF